MPHNQGIRREGGQCPVLYSKKCNLQASQKSSYLNHTIQSRLGRLHTGEKSIYRPKLLPVLAELVESESQGIQIWGTQFQTYWGRCLGEGSISHEPGSRHRANLLSSCPLLVCGPQRLLDSEMIWLSSFKAD